jgi:hypothetical protein
MKLLDVKEGPFTINGRGMFGKGMRLCIGNVDCVVIAPSTLFLDEIKKRIFHKDTDCELIVERTEDLVCCAVKDIRKDTP